MTIHTVKGVCLAAGIFLAAMAMSASANASSLRQGSGSVGAGSTGTIPGQVLWGYYNTSLDIGGPCLDPSFKDTDGCNVGGAGDNILRLINPNGFANINLNGAKAQPVCAMIYVFDDDEEMGECCGCPLTSTQLETFSFLANLTSNWALQGGPEGGEHGNGAVGIVATSVNTGIVAAGPLSNGHGCAFTQSAACNGGCDPSNTPGYVVTTANNVLGSITHNQLVQVGPTTSISSTNGLTEVGLADDAAGDPTNLTYLMNQCGALIGNGTGGGICNCPIE